MVNIKIFSGLIVLFSPLLLIATEVQATPSAKATLEEGIRYYQRHRFKEAMAKLKAVLQVENKNLRANFFLGMAALHSGDKENAKLYLSRVIVMTFPTDQLHTQALSAMKRYFRLTPYSCMVETKAYKGKRGMLVRWSKSSLPLKVYISDGLELPEVYSQTNLTDDRMRTLGKKLQDRNFISACSRAEHYQPGDRQIALEALQQWQWASKEGFLSFEVIKDPAKADILLFWRRYSRKGGFTRYPCAFHQPLVIQITSGAFVKFAGGQRRQMLKTLVAHEFGHAWGLQHAPSKGVLMYPFEPTHLDRKGFLRIARVSESDKSALRALYSLTPDVVMHSVAQKR